MNLFRAFLCSLLLPLSLSAGEGRHLFILSGQSNMAGLKPEESFTPAVEAEFGRDGVIVVKDAHGGQPIRRWVPDWTSAKGEAIEPRGDLYERLLGKVRAAIEGHDLESVTFLWMQGERDAREKHGEVYGRSYHKLLEQLKRDLGREEIFHVIGRLSDFDLENRRYPHWSMLRRVQVELASSGPRGAWVDTDDLNDGKNRRGKEIRDDLHYSAGGYVEFGRRLAHEAITLVRSTIFEEDFEKGFERWELSDPGSWTHREVEGNHVLGIHRRHGDYKPKVRSPGHVALVRDLELADFVLGFRVKSTKDTGGHRDCCVFFNHQDPQNFYYVHLGARPDPHSGQIMIVRDAPRKALTLNEKPTPWKNETWHRVKLIRDSKKGTIEIYFDDMTVPHMTVSDTTFGKGRLGIGSFDDLNDFDDFWVRGR